MYGHDCLSGVVRASTPEEEYWEAYERFYRQRRWLVEKVLRTEAKLGVDGKLDREFLDRVWGKPIDEIRREEEWRKKQEKAVEDWVGPTVQDILTDCVNLLRQAKEGNPGLDPSKAKKFYKETVYKRMAMKFRCPAKIGVKLICKAKVLDDYWYDVTVPMKEMLEAARIGFDGEKFYVGGKGIRLEDLMK